MVGRVILLDFPPEVQRLYPFKCRVKCLSASSILNVEPDAAYLLSLI